MRIPLLLAFVFAIALGGYYLLYVTQVRTYLVGRNIRLLATMARQIENTIDSDRDVLTNLVKDPAGHDKVRTKKDIEDEWEKKKVSNFIPILRTAVVHERSKLQGPKFNMALQFTERRFQSRWDVSDDRSSTGEGGLYFEVRLWELLRPILRDRTDGDTFDLLLVAARDGRVLYQTTGPVRISNINQLTDSGKAGQKFNVLARSSSLDDIVLSGTEYKLFTQPCCPAVTEHQSEKDSDSVGWVLCGLTAKRRLTAASLPVPFTALGILFPLLVLAVLSWPFVKLSLIGDTQRVSAYDAALVGICGLLGAALITVLVLDLFGTAALQGRLDEQLHELASNVGSHVDEEITRASAQLDRLDAAVAANRLPTDAQLSNLAVQLAKSELAEYPFFESFSLVDAKGLQQRKLSIGSFVTPLVPVTRRGYFTHWNTGQYPPPVLEPIQSFTTGSKEVMISKPSSVGGSKVAGLAIPMRSLIEPVVVNGFGFIVIDEDGAVLFHSDPQHSLSENFFDETDNNRRLRALVAARRTEWLDIKYWGDDHRAFVSPLTRRPETLDEKSWKNIERAFVSPLHPEPRPATLITLYDKDLERAVHVEWLVLVMVFVLTYAAVYAGACIGVLVIRPRYRAPWLWPDPAGSRKYLDLLPALLLLLTAFLVAIATLPLVGLLVAASLLPFLAWVISYLVLRSRLTSRGRWQALGWPLLLALCLLAPLLYLATEAEHAMSSAVLVFLLAGAILQAVVAVQRRERSGRSALVPPPNLSYGLAATALLVVIAVLPIVAFFKVAYDMQMETLVKHGQLQLSQDRRQRVLETQADLVAKVPSEGARNLQELRADSKDWGIYDAFFFSTQPGEKKPVRCETSTVEQYALPELMEELLPFYSEGAVRLRELAHDGTADGSWQWRHEGSTLVFCSPALNVAGMRSALPSLFGSSTDWPAVELRAIWLLLGSLLVIGVVIWIVRFVIYNIFVADVIEPLWKGSGDLRPEIWGPHLFLISTTSVVEPISSAGYCVVDLQEAPAKARGWFPEQIARIKRASASQNVLILHFEERLEDSVFNSGKLHLLEAIIKDLNRTVVVVSTVSPSAALEKEIESTPRWAELLSLFTIVPVKPAALPDSPPGPGPLVADWATAGWREIVWRLNALGFAHAARFLDSEREDPEVGRLWKQVLPYAWHPEGTPLEVRQLLVEVGERAEGHYKEIWASCTPAEQLALGHIAEEGLVNRKTKPTIRRLMARGLVRRQPNFVLMTETFRRFVLAMAPSVELATLEESSGDAWAAVRLPFLAVLVAGLVFLFFTQQELFNTTLAVIAGVGTAVPTIMKMASMFGHQRTS
ncbi:MAG: cache domain-containing protein [Acidobacteriota bacterium]